MICVLTGGTGGAKFVDGLRQVMPAEEITLIVNTGDDLLWWGLYVSPDIDSITYVLSGMLSRERGWGVKGDTFLCLQAMGKDVQTVNSDGLSPLFEFLPGSKGLLAMDESTPTCNKRFAALGIPQTEEARRAYREMIVTTPGLNESIGGAILYDETIHQQTGDGTPFVKVLLDAGIIPGIKVDMGAKELAGHPGEKVTEGLDGLRDRLIEYSRLGARFAKWRAVIAIGKDIPSRGCIEANAQALARYAALCQEAGLVGSVFRAALSQCMRLSLWRAANVVVASSAK